MKNGPMTLGGKIACVLASAMMLGGTIALSGCGAPEDNTEPQPNKPANVSKPSNTQNQNTDNTEKETEAQPVADSATVPTKDSIKINETKENSESGGHVIAEDGTQASYANIKAVKTGDSTLNDEADFYGDNSAIFATNGATLDLNEMVVESAGKHANAVFSYGEGTTVNISNSVIETTGDCSGGIMTTGGATMNATNLNISTTGNSSAAIRSDRGGGKVTVSGGIYDKAQSAPSDSLNRAGVNALR